MFFPKLELDKSTIKEIIEQEAPLPSCHHFHDHDCRIPQILKMVNVFKQTARLYFLSHLIPLLLFKRKALKKAPLRTILKLILGWLRSMAFICHYGLFCRKVWCGIIQGNKINMPKFWMYSAISSAGILYEAPGRRSEICMYVVPRWLESLPIFLGKRKLLPNIPMAANLIFAIAIAWITTVYFSDEGAIKSHMHLLTSSIIGKRVEPSDQHSSGSLARTSKVQDLHHE